MSLDKIIRENEIKVTMEDAMSHVKSLLAERYAQYGMNLEEAQLEDLAKKTLGNKEKKFLFAIFKNLRMG